MSEHASSPEHNHTGLISSTWLGVAAIAAAAAVLRYAGIHWGLPNECHMFSYHPDEFHSLRGALAMASGDMNPHFFNYGSLYLYMVGYASIWFSGIDAAAIGFDQLPALLRSWTLLGRYVTIFSAVATVPVVYLLGRKMVNNTIGIVAAAIFAVLPIHVLHSHYATVDITQTLFVAMTLLFALKLYEDPANRWNYILAGLAAGLATSVKYNGALVMIAPIMAFLLVKPWKRDDIPAWKYLIVMVAVAFAAFAFTSPYTFSDWENAKNDIMFEINHMRTGEEPARSADPNGLLFHAFSLLITTTGAAALAVLGGFALLRDAKYRGQAIIVVTFAILWLAMISASGVRYMRYEMALTPVIALLAAATLMLWPRKSTLWKLAGIIGVACVFGLGSYYSCAIDGQLLKPDDRDQLLWVVADIVPQYDRVGMIWEPWFQSPPFDYVNGGAVLRRQPAFQQFSREVRQYVALGMDADALTKLKPFAIVYSNFEMRDGLRAGEQSSEKFMSALQASYQKFTTVQSRAPLAGVLGWVPAQDWLYAFPELNVWVDRDAAILGNEGTVERTP